MSFSKYDPLPAIGSQYPDNSVTNYRSDYIQHPLEKPYVHHGEEYRKPEGDFEKVTSYKQEYTGLFKNEVKLLKQLMRRSDVHSYTV